MVQSNCFDPYCLVISSPTQNEGALGLGIEKPPSHKPWKSSIETEFSRTAQSAARLRLYNTKRGHSPQVGYFWPSPSLTPSNDGATTGQLRPAYLCSLRVLCVDLEVHPLLLPQLANKTVQHNGSQLIRENEHAINCPS